VSAPAKRRDVRHAAGMLRARCASCYVILETVAHSEAAEKSLRRASTRKICQVCHSLMPIEVSLLRTGAPPYIYSTIPDELT